MCPIKICNQTIGRLSPLFIIIIITSMGSVHWIVFLFCPFSQRRKKLHHVTCNFKLAAKDLLIDKGKKRNFFLFNFFTIHGGKIVIIDFHILI